MQKAIDTAKLLVKNPKGNYINDLDDLNLFKVFESIYAMGYTTQEENKLIAFIIFAYDPDSQKLDLRKDRYENKVSIMENIGLDVKKDFVQEILTNSNEKFNNVVLNYLETLTDWRWPTIYANLDFHSSMLRFASQKTEAEKSHDKVIGKGDNQEVKTLTTDIDIDVIAKVNIQKSDLLRRALTAREDAEKLLEEVRKAFVTTDHAVQSDFGFMYTETAKKKVDIMSWREFIKEKNEKELKQKQSVDTD